VLLESGDKIPADVRLIEPKNLRTEEAVLTGESLPAEKTGDAVPVNTTVGSRHHLRTASAACVGRGGSRTTSMRPVLRGLHTLNGGSRRGQLQADRRNQGGP
jgi:P-type E1-E2 ATPase